MRRKLGLIAFLAASVLSPFQEDKLEKSCQPEVIQKQNDELGSLYKEPKKTRRVYKDLKAGSYVIWVEVPEEEVCKPIGIINTGNSKFYLQEVRDDDPEFYPKIEKYTVKSIEP
jgi:hypothetical protein